MLRAMLMPAFDARAARKRRLLLFHAMPIRRQRHATPLFSFHFHADAIFAIFWLIERFDYFISRRHTRASHFMTARRR
jgi:hypothetical protein